MSIKKISFLLGTISLIVGCESQGEFKSPNSSTQTGTLTNDQVLYIASRITPIPCYDKFWSNIISFFTFFIGDVYWYLQDWENQGCLTYEQDGRICLNNCPLDTNNITVSGCFKTGDTPDDVIFEQGFTRNDTSLPITVIDETQVSESIEEIYDGDTYEVFRLTVVSGSLEFTINNTIYTETYNNFKYDYYYFADYSSDPIYEDWSIDIYGQITLQDSVCITEPIEVSIDVNNIGSFYYSIAGVCPGRGSIVANTSIGQIKVNANTINTEALIQIYLDDNLVWEGSCLDLCNKQTYGSCSDAVLILESNGAI